MATGTSWAVFDGFRPPVETWSWAAVDEWNVAVRALLTPARARITECRGRWNDALGHLGGDPGVRDWSTFRTLRRDREEDWSDWLAQLLEDSCTGTFGWTLLGPTEGRKHQTDYVSPRVEREVAFGAVNHLGQHQRCRADLVVHWRDETYTHVEVKVGDPHLAKTLPTAQLMELRHAGRLRRSDVILLMPEQMEAWEQDCSRDRQMGDRVRAITWTDVTKALRKALRVANEEPAWQVWAHTFCGAIEQALLRLPPGPVTEDWAETLDLQALTTASDLFEWKEDR